jgi:8-oxo-dGTP pyrophosphatase MutT (NUDIX family)
MLFPMSAPEPFIPLSSVPDFDPRAATVVHVDSDLAPVARPRLQADFLRSRFTTPPIWQPEVIAESSFTHRTSVPASVLIAVVQRAQPTVLLTQRTAHLSTHSGQIAFPGGKHDAGDKDLRATALREAHEEVGLQAEFVQVLGTLPIYATGTGFTITPVVALVREGFSLVRNPWEVDDVFEVPLEFLMNPANHRRHVFERPGMRREWLSMPYQDGSTERFIWGATAGILRNFYRFLSA